MYCTVLYWTILYCTVLYFTVLYYCTLSYCTLLYCTILYCTVLYWRDCVLVLAAWHLQTWRGRGTLYNISHNWRWWPGNWNINSSNRNKWENLDHEISQESLLSLLRMILGTAQRNRSNTRHQRSRNAEHQIIDNINLYFCTI